jgi:hypothetical protein
MQRRREISPTSDGDASALLVFSICAVQYAINLPQCGAVEGQMRELVGYLVAGRGTEQAAARMAVGIHHRFPCEPFRCKEYPAQSADCTFPGVVVDSTRVPTESHSTDSAKTGTPITNIYAAERFSRHAIEAIASAIPRFGVFD